MKFPWLPNSPNSLASNGPSDSTMPLLPKQQLKRRSCLCLWCDLHSTIDDPMGQVNHENACLVSSATARTWQCASLGTVHIFAYRVIPLESSSESEGSTVQHVSTMFHTYASPSQSNHSNHYPIDSSTEVQYHFRNHRCEEVIDSFSGLLPPVPSSHMWDAKPQSSTRK